MMRRVTMLLVLAALAYPVASRSASDEDIRTVGEQLVCYCGCSGLAVAECSCGTADGIRAKIAGQLDSGLTTEQVVAAWVGERGEQILAVPTREGFNLVGWVMPFLVTFVALSILTITLLRRRPSLVPVTVGGEPASSSDTPSDDERRYLERIDRALRSRRG